MSKTSLFFQDLERAHAILGEAYFTATEKLNRYKTFDENKDLKELYDAIDLLDDTITHTKYFTPLIDQPWGHNAQTNT